jgi:hypothetical protein
MTAIPARNCRFSFFASGRCGEAGHGDGEEMARAPRTTKSKKVENENGVTTRTPKGLKKLSEEADKAIGESSPKITKKMAEIAEEGDLLYTDYLIGLAEKGARPKRKSGERMGMGIAERWANEPVWKGPTPVVAKPVGAGSPAAGAEPTQAASPAPETGPAEKAAS